MDQLSAHLDRGWDLAQKGDARGAGACAKRALEIDPQSPEVHNLLGFTSALAGDTEEAVEHYRQALALDDTYFEAMLNCAELLMHPLGDWEEAIAMVDDALDVAETPEEMADCILLKVDAELGKGDVTAAKRALRLLPDDLEGDQYAFAVGRAHYEVGDYAKALKFVEDAAKRDGENADAAYYLGLLREESSNTRGAVEAFLRARAIDLGRAPPSWSPPPEVFAEIVRKVVHDLDSLLAAHVREAEVFIVDMPGAELVVDGVDPRALLLLDPQGADPFAPAGEDRTPSARLFIYQRNVERAAGAKEFMEEEVQRALEREVAAVFLDKKEPPRLSAKDKSKLN